LLKQTTAAAVLSALALTVTAASADASPRPAATTESAAAITLQFPSWQATEPGYEQFYDSMIKQFETVHKNVTIHFYEVTYVNYMPTITTRISAGDAPDILVLPLTNYGAFDAQAELTPLDSYLKGSPVLTSAWAPLQKSLALHGHTYNVLAQGYSYVLFANKAILAAHHMSIPTSMPALIADSKALTGNGNYGVAIPTAEDPDNPAIAMAIVAGEGSSLVKGTSYDLTSPGVEAAFNQYRALAQYAAPGLITEQARELYFTGKAAFMIDGSYELSGIAQAATKAVNADTIMVKFPTPEQNDAVSSTLSIPASIPASHKQLAWDFIQQTTTLAAQELFVKDVEAPAPLLAANNKVAMPFGPVQAATEGGVNPVPSNTAFLENYGEISNDLETAISKLFSSNATTASVLQSLQGQLPPLK
jgi:multiple sugar transport system substrate-binding protein